MINRILIALLGIPALMFIYYSGGIYLLALTNIIVGIGLFEFYRMSEAIGIKPYKKYWFGSRSFTTKYNLF